MQHRHDAEAEGRPFVIHRWLKSLISHYTSKGILEHHCTKAVATQPGSDIQVSLVAVQGQQRKVSDWPTMQKTIRSVYQPSHASQAEKSIVVLEEIIKQKTTMADKSEKTHPIFFTFRSLLNSEEVLRYVIMHCEAALAVFAKYGPGAYATSTLPSKVSEEDPLQQLAKVRFILFYSLIFH